MATCVRAPLAPCPRVLTRALCRVQMSMWRVGDAASLSPPRSRHAPPIAADSPGSDACASSSTGASSSSAPHTPSYGTAAFAGAPHAHAPSPHSPPAYLAAGTLALGPAPTTPYFPLPGHAGASNLLGVSATYAQFGEGAHAQSASPAMHHPALFGGLDFGLGSLDPLVMDAYGAAQQETGDIGIDILSPYASPAHSPHAQMSAHGGAQQDHILSPYASPMHSPLAQMSAHGYTPPSDSPALESPFEMRSPMELAFAHATDVFSQDAIGFSSQPLATQHSPPHAQPSQHSPHTQHPRHSHSPPFADTPGAPHMPAPGAPPAAPEWHFALYNAHDHLLHAHAVRNAPFAPPETACQCGAAVRVFAFPLLTRMPAATAGWVRGGGWLWNYAYCAPDGAPRDVWLAFASAGGGGAHASTGVCPQCGVRTTLSVRVPFAQQ